MNLVMEFILNVMEFIVNVIYTIFVLVIMVVAIVIVTIRLLVRVPLGCVGCILDTKNVKSIPQYLKEVAKASSKATDEFFHDTSDALIYIWRN